MNYKALLIFLAIFTTSCAVKLPQENRVIEVESGGMQSTASIYIYRKLYGYNAFDLEPPFLYVGKNRVLRLEAGNPIELSVSSGYQKITIRKAVLGFSHTHTDDWEIEALQSTEYFLVLDKRKLTRTTRNEWLV